MIMNYLANARGIQACHVPTRIPWVELFDWINYCGAILFTYTVIFLQALSANADRHSVSRNPILPAIEARVFRILPHQNYGWPVLRMEVVGYYITWAGISFLLKLHVRAYTAKTVKLFSLDETMLCCTLRTWLLSSCSNLLQASTSCCKLITTMFVGCSTALIVSSTAGQLQSVQCSQPSNA